QGGPEQHIQHLIRLRPLRAEKLPAGGSIEEEIADEYRRPARMTHRLRNAWISPFPGYPGPLPRLVRRALELPSRNRRDRRQGLAAEAEGRQRVQILQLPDLGSGVPLEAQLEVGAVHPFPVVEDSNLLQTSPPNLHLDAGGSRVQGVLHQLLD